MQKIRKLVRNPILIAILGSIIALLQFSVSFADSKISDFNSDLIREQNTLNNFFIKLVGNSIARNHYELLSTLNPLFVKQGVQLLSAGNQTDDQVGASTDFAKIRDDFREKKIPIDELLQRATHYYGNTVDGVNREYNTKSEELNKRFQSATPWVYWKKCLQFIELVLLLVIIFIPIYNLHTRESN